MTNQSTRQALLNIIDKGRAHMTVNEMLEGFPIDKINTRAPNVDYSFWGILEHLRICIHLTIDYAVGETFVPLEWPRQFWPATDQVASEADWSATIASVHSGIERLRAIAADESIDLLDRCKHAPADKNDSILFELIDAIDHNAYHIGEFAVLRQVCGLWPDGHQ